MTTYIENMDAPLNRVPKVTLDFWLIKLMAVTMGETAADYLAVNLRLGLTGTSLLMGGVLVIAMVVQLSRKRYIPAPYWTAVVLISVVGTLITDNLVDNFGVALQTTAILFTFALGTGAGDLISEAFGLGYLTTGMLFGAIIAATTFAFYGFKMNGILAFWLAYILTRPLGASFGDLLSQPKDAGGMGLGTVYTSLLFLGMIVLIVIYMSLNYEPEKVETES